MLAAVGAGWAILVHPLGPLWIGIPALVYAAWLWRFPHHWPLGLLAGFPVLDLAPWTGRFFFDEFDLCVLVTAAVGLWRLDISREQPRLGGPTRGLLAILGLSYASSLAIGLLPLPPLDDNAFTTYLSHYNGLRVAKGFLWTALLLPLVRAQATHPRHRDLWAGGMTAGMAAFVAVALYERVLFSGPFNFAIDYRITGLFSGMHTGGPQVETYAVFGLPFVCLWVLHRQRAVSRAAGLALVGGAVYAILVTYSRGGYLGLLVAALVLAAGGAVRLRRARAAGRSARWWMVPVACLAGGVAALPALSGPYVHGRLANIGIDLETRVAHWRRAIDLMDRDGRTALLGMGLGRFPSTHAARGGPGARPANFEFRRAAGDGYLRLGPGDSLYLGQRVSVAPGVRYTVSMGLRSPGGGVARLAVYLCEKHLLYSFRCARRVLDARPGAAGWERLEVPIDSGDVSRSRRWYTRRPVEFAISHAGGGAIDVDNVRLLSPDGRDLLHNGDFQRGGERWFFTTDNAIPWHADNMWVQALFEQGMLGLVTLAALLAVPLGRLTMGLWHGDGFSACALAAAAGLLTIGLTGSVFESPRFFVLLMTSLFAAELALAPRAAGVARREA